MSRADSNSTIMANRDGPKVVVLGAWFGKAKSCRFQKRGNWKTG